MAVSPQPALYPTGNDAATSAAIALLIHYFDLAPASAQLLVKKWLANYPAIWVRSAVTEALYQGRYKPFSVEQILAFWQRRGKSIAHFNVEFETLIAVPLQGSFKTETDVAIEAVHDNLASPPPSAAPETALVPSTTLAEALEAADQGQPTDGAPLPRPRLMLPGELPGKGLAQRPAGAKNDARPTSEQSPSAPQLPGASSLSQPQGFEGVLDPRPRPQVTQGPDSALVAEAKSKQIQPPPIGRFTPAADPSGFASRLKTVVEQAIAKTQEEEEQLSLETAIASQLANDPILGQPGSEEASASDKAPTTQSQDRPPAALDEAAELPDAAVSGEPSEAGAKLSLSLETQSEEAVPSQTDITAQENDPWEIDAAVEAERSELDASTEPAASRETEVIVAAISLARTTELEQPSAADLRPEVPGEAPQEMSSETAGEISTEAPAPSPAEVAIAQDPEASKAFKKPEIPEDGNPEAPSVLTAPFEDRFPLTSPSETLSEDTDAPRDAIDIELDNHLFETRLDEEPDMTLTPPDNDQLNLVFETEPEPQTSPRSRFQAAIDADEAALLALESDSPLLNGDALSRHLDRGFDDDRLTEETSDVTRAIGPTIAPDQPPAVTHEPMASASPQDVDPPSQDGAPRESTEPDQPAQPPVVLQDSPPNLTSLSSLVAGLTQPSSTNSAAATAFPSIDALEPNSAPGDNDEASADEA